MFLSIKTNKLHPGLFVVPRGWSVFWQPGSPCSGLLAEAPCHWGTWGTFPKTVLRICDCGW